MVPHCSFQPSVCTFLQMIPQGPTHPFFSLSFRTPLEKAWGKGWSLLQLHCYRGAERKILALKACTDALVSMISNIMYLIFRLHFSVLLAAPWSPSPIVGMTPPQILLIFFICSFKFYCFEIWFEISNVYPKDWIHFYSLSDLDVF